MKRARSTRSGLVIGISSLLAGCNTPSPPGDNFSSGSWFSGVAASASQQKAAGPGVIGAGSLTTGRPARSAADWGSTARAYPASTAVGRPAGTSDGEVTLDFVDVEMQAFVRTVFNEILHENVAVDPALSGRVTVRTPQPVSRDVALSYVRGVVEMNGGKLTKQDGLYRVSSAASGSSQSNSRFEVIRLNSASAKDVAASLRAAAGPETQISTGPDDRFLIVGGSSSGVEALANLAHSLDIDELAGRSFILQTLKQASAVSVAKEIGAMFGKRIKALPLTRINAVLIIGDDKVAVQRAIRWIAQLDTGNDASQQIFVYPVQNRRAADLEKLLSNIVGRSSSQTDDAGTIAPAFAPEPVESGGNVQMNIDARFAPSADEMQANILPTSTAADASLLKTGGGADALAGAHVRADNGTNSLVVAARPEDWPMIEATIRRLDALPKQVLVEVMIVEVTLNKSLKHGVRWYLQNGNHALSLTDGDSANSALSSGLNYVFEIPEAKLVINALESLTDVQVISSPALTVLDNQTAKLQVGDEVPIATRSATSVSTPDAPLVSEIEMRQTGVILSVTPRVNASGLVMLDITQESSDVVQTTTSGLNSPTIRNRTINSTVSVTSGTEIILGGLISNRTDRGRDGVPVLKDVPLLGELFTTNRLLSHAKTELMIILRPTVLNDMNDVRLMTQDIKSVLSAH